MRFISEILHPNSECWFLINTGLNFSFLLKNEFVHLVDKDGNVCISILHEPGDDSFGYEKAGSNSNSRCKFACMYNPFPT